MSPRATIMATNTSQDRDRPTMKKGAKADVPYVAYSLRIQHNHRADQPSQNNNGNNGPPRRGG